MNELYEKPLHTEGNFWAGYDRNNILRIIEAGLHYLTTTDLVNLHATISAVQISRDHNQRRKRLQEYELFKMDKFAFYTYWCSSKVYDKQDELFACHTSIDGQYMFTYTEVKKIIDSLQTF